MAMSDRRAWVGELSVCRAVRRSDQEVPHAVAEVVTGKFEKALRDLASQMIRAYCDTQRQKIYHFHVSHDKSNV